MVMMRAELNYSGVWSKDKDKWRSLAQGHMMVRLFCVVTILTLTIIRFGRIYFLCNPDLEEDDCDDDGDLPCATGKNARMQQLQE